MKGPICSICMASDILCAACHEKVKEGNVNHITLEVVRFLASLEKKYNNLKDAEVKRVMDLGKGILVVAASGSGGKVVGRGGAIVNELGRKYGNARVVEEGSLEQMIQSLVFPARPIRMNRVYGKGGEKYRLIVKREDRKKIAIGNEEFSFITKKLGAEAEIAFE